MVCSRQDVLCRVHEALGTLVDRFGLEQGEPEVRHATEEPLKLGLVAHWARQQRVTASSRERHAVKSGLELVAELSLHDQPIVPISHAIEHPTAQ